LAEVFLKDSSGQLAGILGSIDRGDLAALERAAHSLKGSVANFGAQRTFEVASHLEKMARSGDLAGCRRLSAVLEEEMEALKLELMRLRADKE